MPVTPWEVTGHIDYEKLVKDFGTQHIEDTLLERMKKHTKDLHFMLRRKIFFSHRDLGWVLDEYDKGNKFYLYTGRAPSGQIHIGHLTPWIFTKWLQDKFDAELWFQFPDEEKFLFNDKITFEDTEKFTNDNMLDIIALGFNPKKTKFLVDTMHAKLMYKQACRVAKKITFSTAKAVFGFQNETNIGSIFYTSMQSVPAFLPSVLAEKNIPCLIPYGIDQDPHFRVCRDVLPKIGYYKPAALHCIFLPGMQGPDSKMSSSQPETAIFTTDTPEIARKKIMKSFSGGAPSLEEHRKNGGNPNIDTACQYLFMMFEEDDKKIKEIFENYRSGSLTTGDVKNILADKVEIFLKNHQKKREQAKNNIDKFILKD